jgi:Methyltransferase domain
MLKQAAQGAIRLLLRVKLLNRLLESVLRKSHPILSNPQIRFMPPGHFYSPLPDLAQEAPRQQSAADTLQGIELNLEAQLRLVRELSPIAARYDWPVHATPERRFWSENQFYGACDASTLYAMTRHFGSQRLIEVGSGFSSALLLDANEFHDGPKCHLTFIEPFPDERLNKLLKPGDRQSTRIIVDQVQNVGLELFRELKENDILLIDSSHVSKYHSDVNDLFFHILPALNRGVIIHIHDIFYPFEYPDHWLKQGRAWNEAYLLRAFLMNNPQFEIVFFNDYLGQTQGEQLKQYLPLMHPIAGGAIWLRKKV